MRHVGEYPRLCRPSGFSLGGDSLAAAELTVALRKRFDANLPMAAILDSPTVNQLVEVLSQRRRFDVGSVLVPLQSQGREAPFFCVHGVGGEVLSFTELAKRLGAERPFIGIHACGPPNEPEPVESMAARYLAAMRAMQSHGPYYLGGYSFGGSVALEIAQQLVQQGESVALLAILDHTLPPLRYERHWWQPSFWRQFIVNLPAWLRDDLWAMGWRHFQKKIRLKTSAFWRKLACRFRNQEAGLPEVAGVFDVAHLPDSFRRQMECNYLALRAYVPRVYPGRVTLFRARTRPLLRLHGWDLGWSKLAGGGLDIIPIPGNHETMLRPPHVQVLAEALRRQFAAARVQPAATLREPPS